MLRDPLLPPVSGQPDEGTIPVRNYQLPAMEYHVTYEYSLSDAPDDYIGAVPSQLVREVPSTIPPVLLPEFIRNQILQRSPQIANVRSLQILRAVSPEPLAK